ncbi:MAG: DNA translocase FtsK [Chloroflexi bacterium]|nr:DNA translocase FtsK [Chloroflexota bacterium]
MTKRSRSRRPSTRKSSSSANKRRKSSKSGRKTTSRRRRKPTLGVQILNVVSNGALWGVVLVVLGIFSALALLSPQRGSITGWWLQQLSLAVGVGVYVTPVMLIIVGLYLYLRSNQRIRSFTITRLLGLLLLWAVFQATVHLLTAAIDPLGRTLPGDYGGWVGWVISQLLVEMFGSALALTALLGMALLGIILLLGMSLNDLFALALLSLTAFTVFLASLPQKWQARRAGVVRDKPSLGERIKTWWQERRKPASPLAVEVGLDGPVSSLPADKAHATVVTETPPPTIRIIGGEETTWRLPEVANILDDFSTADLTEEDLAERAKIIEDTLHSFNVPVTVVEVNKGPVVTQFGLRPGYITRNVRGEEKRMKISVKKIQALANDLSLALAAAPIRIEAPVPGRDIVGLEVPNQSVTMVSLRSILESEEFQSLQAPLRIGLGQDVSGAAVAASLARMPHLLIAGATGSGKSVCVNAVICSLLFQYTPDELRFVLVDPKRVELTGYNDIPHLVAPVVTEIDKVVGVLHWATKEMDNRYRVLSKAGARNIEAYNLRRLTEGKRLMPYIVIIIDELADIMMMSPDEVEKSLVRVAQMARATGIHLVIATQRPSVNVVTGLIKANFPSRIAFAVTSQIDSRVILDTPGAERLLGRGDMLFMRPDSAKLARLQGAFVSDTEVNRLVRYWRGLGGVRSPQASEATGVSAQDGGGAGEGGTLGPAVQRPLWEDIIAEVEEGSKRDVLYDEAVRVITEAGRASTSLLQRRLRVGYTRAARLIDMMEEDGLIGPDRGGTRGREVLISEPEVEEPSEAEPDDTPPF